MWLGGTTVVLIALLVVLVFSMVNRIDSKKLMAVTLLMTFFTFVVAALAVTVPINSIDLF